jgi:hypothetical protein
MPNSPIQADLVLSLETLPTLVLDQICELLVADGRDGICSFSLTSLSCAAVSRRFRLRCIHLRILDKTHLTQDVKHLEAAIGSLGQYSGHLRQLKLSGSMHVTDGHSYPPQRPNEPTTSASFEDFVKFPREDNPRGDSEIAGARLPPEDMKRKLNELWRPLSEFISRLSLNDLIYACKNQFPRCLLEVLHQHSPQTRLHMHKFAIRSLHPLEDLSTSVDPDEYTLLTSPCLTSIVFKYLNNHIGPERVYKNVVLEALLAGIAPNIRQLSVRVVAIQPESENSSIRRILWPSPSVESFNGSPEVSKARLETLVCDSNLINDVLNRIYIEQLAVLRIDHFVHLDLVRQLVNKAQTVGFKSLSDLSLFIICASAEARPELDFQAGLLLRALPPLTRLELHGHVGSNAVSAIWDVHGDCLKSLDFGSIEQSISAMGGEITFGHVRYPPGGLSKLERLETCIHRTWPTGGDEQDLETVRVLGKLPRLRHLVLDLDVSAIGLDPPEIRDEGSRVTAPIFRDALMRSAVDSKLAKEMFQLIRGSNGPLQYLEIQVRGAGDFGNHWWDSEAASVLSWISPDWICEQKPGRELTATEMEYSRSTGDILRDDFDDRDDLRAVWKEIWPGNGGDRREDWSSFPLMRT